MSFSALRMRLGLISDTHDFLDPRLAEVFASVDHIIHAGDVGRPRVLMALEQLAPVTAVGGNTDPSDLYPEVRCVTLDGLVCLVRHIVDPSNPDLTLQRLLAQEQPDLVVFGHTHRPSSATIGDRLFVNPGYAGRPRLGVKRSVAVLDTREMPLQPRFVSLGHLPHQTEQE